ncbi:MAG TPA: exosortase/archaeosortase family protein, partial [Isosphaeraceae bacterium]
MSSNPAATASGAAVRTHRPPPPLVALLREGMADPEGRLTLLGAAAAAVLLATMFASNILHFLTVWATDENYSHGFLVPLITLYFANEAARRGPIAEEDGTRLGVALIVTSILGRLATIAVPVGFVGDLSLVLGLAGVVALLFGRGALRRFGFSIGFLNFMIPLPIALY